MTTETTVSGSGAVAQHNPMAREPRTQAEADAIMATWANAPRSGEIRVRPINGPLDAAAMPSAPASPPAAAAPVASPSTGALLASAIEQRAAQLAIKAEGPELMRRILSGDVAAKERYGKLHETAADRPVPEAAPAEAPKVDADGYRPAAGHEIAMPNLVEIQREAVARGEAQGGDAELIAAVERGQSMLAAAEFSKEAAGAIAADFARDEPVLRAMDDVAWKLHESGVQAQLERKWGGKTADMMGLARLVMKAADEQNPGTIKFLRSSGMGSHLPTLIRMAEHGVHLAERAGRSVESLRNEFPKLFK